MTNQYASLNRMAPGGDTWIIGGALKRDGAVSGDDDQALSVFLPVHYQIAPDAISTTITNPDVPRTVTIKGNAGGIAGNVVVHGTNVEGAVITDTIALNGATEVEGVK